MSKRVFWKMEWRGATLRLEGDYSPGRPGVHTLSNGDPGWPDEPPELYITEVEAWLDVQGHKQWVDVTNLAEAFGVEFDNPEDPFCGAAEEALEDQLAAEAEDYRCEEDD